MATNLPSGLCTELPPPLPPPSVRGSRLLSLIGVALLSSRLFLAHVLSLHVGVAHHAQVKKEASEEKLKRIEKLAKRSGKRNKERKKAHSEKKSGRRVDRRDY